MRIFISQMMKNKNINEIKSERDFIIKDLKLKYGENILILDSVFTFSKLHNSLFYLSKSIEVLSNANLALFSKNYSKGRGCRIEYVCAKEYGINIGFYDE